MPGLIESSMPYLQRISKISEMDLCIVSGAIKILDSISEKTDKERRLLDKLVSLRSDVVEGKRKVCRLYVRDVLTVSITATSIVGMLVSLYGIIFVGSIYNLIWLFVYGITVLVLFRKAKAYVGGCKAIKAVTTNFLYEKDFRRSDEVRINSLLYIGTVLAELVPESIYERSNNGR